MECTQAFDGKCKNTKYNINTWLNNGLDNNISLLKLSPDEHYNKWILQKPNERFYGNSFAYRVIE